MASPTCLFFELLAIYAVCALSCDRNLVDNLEESFPEDGLGARTTVYCIEADSDDVKMVVIFDGTHANTEAQIQVTLNDQQCQNCETCVSLGEDKCASEDTCPCNLHCLQGPCSQTIAPISPGTWRISVTAMPGYTIRARLLPIIVLTDGRTHESSLASVEPYLSESRVVETTPWWDFYSLEATEDGVMTVIVQNLEDSGPMRGYVDVVMRVGDVPNKDHNDAVYSTYTRDTVEAHLKNVHKGQVAYIGVLGRGHERWIRYTIRVGAFKLATVYAILGVVSLALLLVGFVACYKRQASKRNAKGQLFHSRVYS